MQAKDDTGVGIGHSANEVVAVDRRTKKSLNQSSIALWILSTFFTARLLAADIAGIVTNDSLGYLSRASSAPFGEGLVVQGYRQVAQPTWVRFTGIVGSIAGWDRVFSVAMAQRAILLFGILLVVYALRWWAVPALMVITTPVFVVHSDFVLPEGFLVPWCVVAAGLAAAVATDRPLTRKYPFHVAGASAAVAFVTATVKLQYTSLLCLTAAVAWLLWKQHRLSQKQAVAVLAIPFVLLATLAVAQSFENQRELGVFEPVSERARAEWYGAWQATFVVEQDNRSDAALVEWFDGGNLYTYLWEIESDVPAYQERVDLVDSRIEDMFEAAGTSHRREQALAFLGGLQAGRTDDLTTIVNGALEATKSDPDLRLTRNNIGNRDGVDAVLDEVNEGRVAGFLSTSTFFGPLGSLYEDYRGHKAALAMASIALLLLSVPFGGRHRPTSLAALGLIGSVSVALGSAYIDNARYLLGPFAIVLIMASVAARSVVQGRIAQGET